MVTGLSQPDHLPTELEPTGALQTDEQRKVWVASEDVGYADWHIRHVFGNEEAAMEWLSHMRIDHPAPFNFDVEAYEVEETYAD